MKAKLFSILLTILLLMLTAAHGAIWEVDNTDISELFFTTIQAAHDSEVAVEADGETWSFIIPALGIEDDPSLQIPGDYYLSSNFPNPFNAQTRLTFGLPEPGDVLITILDSNGKAVATLASGFHAAGRFETTWQAGRHPSGIYLAKYQSGSFTVVRKIVLLR